MSSRCGIARRRRRTRRAARAGLGIAAAALLVAATAGARPTGIQPESHYIGNDAPAWAPDGSHIAFIAFRKGRFGDVFTMDADGRGVTRLTSTPEHEDVPTWSPDGSLIAYVALHNEAFQIFVVNANGGARRQLTTQGSNYGPTWSPDGRRLAFRSDRDGNGEIYVMNADGSDQTRVTNNPADEHLPAWSPDGTKLAFASNRNRLAFQLYVASVDGHNEHRLTADPTNYHEEQRPAWSPDGTKVAFVSNRDPPLGNTEIYVVDADGTNSRRLTHNDLREDWPAWSPDGTRIAFSRGFHIFRPEIYVMAPTGQSAHKITGTNLRFVRISRTPKTPKAGRLFVVELTVKPALDRYADPTCLAAIAGKLVPLQLGDVVRGRIRCEWFIPRSAKSRRLRYIVAAQAGGTQVTRAAAAVVR
jgi:Tol biopolymer transport system component